MEIKFYYFTKRENSTALPSDTEENKVITVNGEFKGSFDLLRPVVKINTLSMIRYSYCYIPSLQRYYFIEKWEFIDGMWYVHLKEDVLATWRWRVLDSTQYVSRSAVRSDGDIIDNYYPVKSGTETRYSVYDYFINDTVDKGCFILGVVGQNTEDDTGLCYYSVKSHELSFLMKYLLSNPDYLKIPESEISKELTKALFNPIQYIKTAIFLPHNVTGTDTTIKLGWWDTGISARRVKTDSKFNLWKVLTIPKHPDIARGSYLNASPFTRYTLTFQPFGSFVLDSNVLKNYNTVTVMTTTSVVTGDTILKITCGNFGESSNNYILASAVCNIAVPIAITQLVRNDIGMIKSYASVVGDLATLNIGKAFSDVGNAIENSQPKADIRNNTGSFSQVQEQLVLCTEFRHLVDEDNEHLGRPLCKKVKLSSLSGFTKVMNASVETPSTQEEQAMIESFLNGGFYIE